MPELRERMRRELVNAGHEQATALVRRHLKDVPTMNIDVEAGVVVLLGGLIDYRRMQWTFGDAPLDVDEERIVRTWVAMVLALAGAQRRPPQEREDQR